MRIAASLVLAVAVALVFATKIEIVAVAAVVVCGVAWIVDRGALGSVLRVGLVLGVVFAAAVAAAAVAWTSGVERGLVAGGAVLLRLLVLGTAAAVVARNVDADRLQRAMSRLGMERLGLLFGLALNAMPHLSETAATVWSAHRVRSGGRWRAFRRLPVLVEVLLAHTSRVADQAAAAAALRGHTALTRRTAPLAVGARTVVVTGLPGSGKTPAVRAVADELIRRKIPVRGFLQPAIVEDGRKVGFRLCDLATGEVVELARRVTQGDGMHGTSFRFADAGFELGAKALAGARPGSIVIVDELGPVELRGGGHWPAVERALAIPGLAGVVVVVRRTLVPSLLEALGAADAVVVDLEIVAGDAAAAVLGELVTDP